MQLTRINSTANSPFSILNPGSPQHEVIRSQHQTVLVRYLQATVERVQICDWVGDLDFHTVREDI